MQLHYQRSGSGTPLLILHGLFGTLENWGGISKTLSERFDVISIDLRNHGRSPHSETMDYPTMAQDIAELIDTLGVSPCYMLGHSMGGKVAMELALNQPQLISKLIIADIAPVAYPDHHEQVFSGLSKIDLSSLSSRNEADEQLKHMIPEASTRAFLLKNLYRTPTKQFAWRMNLSVLEQEYAKISAAPKGSPYQGPTLFIKGALSQYIQREHQQAIETLFPNYQFKIIEGTGHWPHAEKPALFLKLVERFLLSEGKDYA